MPIEKTDKIWMDGELVNWDDAKIHVLTHTLHYGSGVFEGIRAYPTSRGPAVFRLTDHMRRLHDSAMLIHMEIPYSVEELVEATKETIRVNKVDSCYIRPLAYLGYGEMGLNPLPCTVNVSIAVWPWGTYLGDEGLKRGVRMKTSTWRRMDPNINPVAAKGTGIYINSSLAKVEALKGGYDEAILLNTAGSVAEATGENVFIVKNGVLLTPPLSAGALDGITRDSVMTIARDFGYEVREQTLLRTDLYLADEAFLCGTAAEVVPIREVDDHEIGDPGEITRKIQETYFATIHGEVEKYADWLEHANDG
jgi:branched-chain amino acid aminotransferase